MTVYGPRFTQLLAVCDAHNGATDEQKSERKTL